MFVHYTVVMMNPRIIFTIVIYWYTEAASTINTKHKLKIHIKHNVIHFTVLCICYEFFLIIYDDGKNPFEVFIKL